MPPDPSHPHSTRLENLHLEPDAAAFDLDGRPVRIQAEAGQPSVAALRSFYQWALTDFNARRSAPAKPSWLTRVKSWLGRWLGSSPPRPVPAAIPAPPAPRSDAKSADRPVIPPGPSAAAAVKIPPTAKSAPAPALRAVFADRGGVHLVWHAPATATSQQSIELVYDLNSDLARRLQDCYGCLAALGYKVVGLELAPIGAKAPDQPAEHQPTRAPVLSVGPNVGPDKSAGKKEPARVMRLHPGLPEEPDRVLVSPVENREKVQVLVAPERLVRALRSAAEPARPVDERLTYLRCAQGKGGLKVVDVGLGEGQGLLPARWEKVSDWSARQAETTAPEKRPQPKAGPELNL